MTNKPNIALITGGYNAEREISLQTAALIKQALPSNKYNVYEIDITKSGWHRYEGTTTVDLNTFSITDKTKTIHFDAAYIALHGTPAEDGKIQAYLDIQNIPYTGCSSFVSALTFDKFRTKELLHNYDVPMAQGTLIEKTTYKNNATILDDFSNRNYPLFVKPNQNGSSYGASKVENFDELPEAVNHAFDYDTSVLIEEFIAGRECTCGAFRDKNGVVHALPITEIITQQAFFDYAAKYEKQSQEITPAEFTEKQTQTCHNLTKKIYTKLDCKGCVRIDFILHDQTFYFLEVNTIPGLTPTSLIPQQLEAAGYNLLEFLEGVLPKIK